MGGSKAHLLKVVVAVVVVVKRICSRMSFPFIKATPMPKRHGGGTRPYCPIFLHSTCIAFVLSGGWMGGSKAHLFKRAYPVA